MHRDLESGGGGLTKKKKQSDITIKSVLGELDELAESDEQGIRSKLKILEIKALLLVARYVSEIAKESGIIS